MELVHLIASQNALGEGPLWCAETGTLYWVDILGKTINQYNLQERIHEIYPQQEQISVIAFREQGGFVVAGENGFKFWSPKDNHLTAIIDPESGKQNARFNDGKVDRKGRFWAGTMTTSDASSALYRMDRDLSLRLMEGGITISNGIGWSLDNQVMYYADTLHHVIYAYDFDLESGAITNRKDFFRVPAGFGVPDGLTVDQEGFVWCAFYGGAMVRRFNPNGEIDLEVPLPVSQPTSCAFGGESMRDLFITTAWAGLTDAERKAQPQAGDVFMLHAAVQGMPEPSFLG